jgi:hypothetical protein
VERLLSNPGNWYKEENNSLEKPSQLIPLPIIFYKRRLKSRPSSSLPIKSNKLKKIQSPSKISIELEDRGSDPLSPE